MRNQIKTWLRATLSLIVDFDAQLGVYLSLFAINLRPSLS